MKNFEDKIKERSFFNRIFHSASKVKKKKKRKKRRKKEKEVKSEGKQILFDRGSFSLFFFLR